MKKEHSVFITFEPHEVEAILDREARRLGLLKDIKSTVEHSLLDDVEVNIEYKWEEQLR